MERSAQFASIAADARRIGELTAAAPDATVLSCPDWTGRDLRAHVVGFARYIADIVAAGGAELSPPPPVPRTWPARATTPTWTGCSTSSGAPRPTRRPTSGRPQPRSPGSGSGGCCTSWRCTAGTPPPWCRPAEPIPAPVAVDGIAEFFDEFVATALARGLVPPAARTLALEITDLDRRLEYPLPDPGPVTTIRGTASDLLLALWRRHDPLSLHVDGDPAVLEAWPSI